MDQIQRDASLAEICVAGFYKHLLDCIATTNKNSGKHLLRHIEDELVATDKIDTLFFKTIENYLEKGRGR